MQEREGVCHLPLASPITSWGMMPTPFAGPDAALDLTSLGRVVRRYVADGCDGVVVLGVVGEPATLTEA
ncbi:hypothetical protein GCM10010399_08480 [Dactylosporangium fulvum]|uniref:Dihydrodipicolinate synthase n=1 Tax=Dactylosporangium fulvum TaxID=53359 RepID=A0ABY5WAK2_9ACTN|nr:hypothetical protein [Dactylosporangium fulvum]UWP86514.1 hypothetical protein Dfulv_20640 [Dactylosporangium fulvum]